MAADYVGTCRFAFVRGGSRLFAWIMEPSLINVR